MIVRSKTRPSTSLRLLCDAAAELGLDPLDCLKDTGVTLKDLENPETLHSTEQELRTIQNFVALAPSNVGLGVRVGRKMHVNAFGIWGFAILTSPTLRSAIETAVEYVRLSFVVADMELAEEGGRGRLDFGMNDLPDAVHRFLLERHSIVAMNFIQALLQRDDLQGFEIETTDTDPDYPPALSDMTGLPVQGAMARQALSFPADLMDLPLPKSDPVTLRFCLEQCKALAESTKGDLPPWSQKVRDAVIDDISSDQRIEDIASLLSVTERTLRRRLTEEGTSFRELYIDARMAIAHELLDTAGLNVETVAWRVGYAEPASFVRAFSKRYGKTPSEIRRRTAPPVTADA